MDIEADVVCRTGFLTCALLGLALSALAWVAAIKSDRSQLEQGWERRCHALRGKAEVISTVTVLFIAAGVVSHLATVKKIRDRKD